MVCERLDERVRWYVRGVRPVGGGKIIIGKKTSKRTIKYEQ